VDDPKHLLGRRPGRMAAVLRSAREKDGSYEEQADG
jgi:hypothetical protein